MSTPKKYQEKRLEEILEMIGKLAALDFSETLKIHGKHDMFDAIGLGLNMLSEELKSSIVERNALNFTNKKLERFALTTAHDLKSPLNTIIGLVRILEISQEAGNTEEVKESLDKLRQTTESMKFMVQGILDYSKSKDREFHQENVDLNLLVDELIDSDIISQDVEVTRDENLPKVLFNRSALTQVIRNILNNAVKYSDKSPCIININTKEKASHFEINIADNGPGIEDIYHEEIFKLYKKVNSDTPKEGQGIGLATVKNILELSGEKIWVNSSPESGSIFTFTIKK